RGSRGRAGVGGTRARTHTAAAALQARTERLHLAHRGAAIDRMAALDRGGVDGRRGSERSTRVGGARAVRGGAHADTTPAWRPARGGPAHGMAVGHAARIGPTAPGGPGGSAAG